MMYVIHVATFFLLLIEIDAAYVVQFCLKNFRIYQLLRNDPAAWT
jgi:hypothetical protein